MLDALTTAWSRPYKIVRVFQALGMDVPQRLRRERLALMLAALERSRIEAVLADNSPIDPDDSPGIEAKIRLRRLEEPPADRTVLGYDVLRAIVSGGMSECYVVRDAAGTTRFLKVVPTRGINGDALRREIDIYAKLERAEAQHVLRVFETIQGDDRLGLVMDYADGGTLEQHLDRPDVLDLAEVKAIAMAVLEGLRELHALGIVHRDLKPQNVLRCAGAWKLGDFGISKNLARLVTRGRTFQGVGTVGYTPPEQWQGRAAHPTADVYAFGKLLVALCAQGETDIDMLWNQPHVARIVRSCVAFEPDARASLHALQAEVSRL